MDDCFDNVTIRSIENEIVNTIKGELGKYLYDIGQNDSYPSMWIIRTSAVEYVKVVFPYTYPATKVLLSRPERTTSPPNWGIVSAPLGVTTLSLKCVSVVILGRISLSGIVNSQRRANGHTCFAPCRTM